MRANYGAALRNFLISKVKLEKLIDFGDLPVFEDASAYPMVILFSNTLRNGAAIEYAQIKNLDFESLPVAIDATASKMPESAFSGSNWSLAEDARQKVLNKLKSNVLTLEKYIGRNNIRRGILTGFNEAFIINDATRNLLIAENPKSSEIIKPFLVGEDVRRFSTNFRDRYLIWTYTDVPIKQYPAIYRYLQQYQAQLEKRWDKGNYWWELRHCDYYAEFEKPKIIYPVIAASNKFAFDEEGYYSNDKTFFIPTNNLYLLSILNSSIAFLFFRAKLSGLRGDFLEYRAQTLVNTPIRRINFVTSDKDRARYRDKARLLYQQCLQEQGKPDCIMGFVKHHLAQQPEASDVVHDLLAYLAQEMLDLNKQKRALQKKFLEEYLVPVLRIKPDKSGKSGLDVLTGKGKLQDYPGDYQKGEAALDPDELWDIIRKNRTRLDVNLAQPGFKERIQAKYQESLGEILPLKEQLKHTDMLIDQVVYALYGLSEEEIAVVEGK
jgi:predicted house-cleaning noncanonical NTP pyrophosphatase (MazG superfamily)